jgi:hypothetical protein
MILDIMMNIGDVLFLMMVLAESKELETIV